MADENESAFAVYTGKSTLSKGQKKRKKVKEGKKLDISLSKLERIQKKMDKKNKILAKSLNGADDEKILKKDKQKKHQKKLLLEKNFISIPKEKTLKKKKKVTSPMLEETHKALQKPTPDFEKNMVHDTNNHNLSELTDHSVIHPVNATFNIVDKKENKIKKKVQISSDLPVTDKKSSNKVIISTPRFQRKVESPKDSKNLSKNQILNAVDSYVKNRKKNSKENSSKDKKLLMFEELAKEAKQIVETQGSRQAFGEATLLKILQPFSVASFLRDHWEKKPIHIPGKEDKFSSFISTEIIDSILRQNILFFGKHIDVTTYTNGVRETHNPEGRAHAHVVWDFYSNGCSVRLLNPQYFLSSIHLLNANLQELFGCFVGANVYLTPPNSQGFAPHYDDIEAFILQVEGSKIWKIYAPINKDGYLPRYSSRNLTDEEIGEPIMELTLKAGDVLYFPRGYIHQGRTEDQHSLHITLSTYQQTSWFNLLEKALPLTLEKASKQDVEFRKGLPISYLESAGFAFKSAGQKKKVIFDQLKKLMHRMVDFLEVDEAMDVMGLKFIQEALPPVLTSREAACSVVGGGLRMAKEGKLSHHILFPLSTCVRWIRKNCFRVVEEEVTIEDGTIEKQVRIYYTLDNSREYRKEEPQFIIIPPSLVPAVLYLVTAYPEYTEISNIPGDDDDEKVALVGDLWDRGLLMTLEPLEEVSSKNEENSPAKNLTLSKEEEEVFADLLDAVPHGSENPESTMCSDEEIVMANDNESSNSCEVMYEDEPIKHDSESETSSVTLS